MKDFEYQVNHNKVPSSWTPKFIRQKKIAAIFALLVAKIAEDLSFVETIGEEYWDTRQIMRRVIDDRPISKCRKDFEKDRLVLFLDTSPSCSGMARFYSTIASAAAARDDIEIYLVPNGYIESRYDARKKVFVRDNRGTNWQMKGRTIVYFTDWDGQNQIIAHSRTNTVYWLDRIGIRDWMSGDYLQGLLRRFRGKRMICQNENDIIKIAKKIK